MVLSGLFEPFKRSVKLVSSNDNPMSSVYPIVIALRNEILKVLKHPKFDEILGSGKIEKVKSLLRLRFNLSELAPKFPETKVGILDQYQI